MKTKSIDVKISANFDVDLNNKGPKLKVGDHVRIKFCTILHPKLVRRRFRY